MKVLLIISVFFLIGQTVLAQRFNIQSINVNEGLSGSSVNDIMEDQFGRLWIATKNNGITIYDGKNFSYINIENHLSTNIVNDLLIDHNNHIWIATPEGLVEYDGTKYHRYTFADGLSSNKIKCLYLDNQNDIWIGTDGGGLNRFDGKNFTNYNSDKSFSGNSVGAMIQSDEGLFIGTSNGLILYNGDGFYEVKRSQIFGLGSVTSMTKTDSSIFIGTLNGLFEYHEGQVYDRTYKFKISSNIILSLHYDSDDRLWVGTAGEGVNRIEKGKNKTISEVNGLSSNVINCFFEDESLNIWIGTLSGGISKYAGDAFTYYTEQGSLNSNFVYGFFEDHTSQIWIGTGDGITLFKDGDFSKLDRSNGLRATQVFCFEEYDESIWIGTSNGVHIFKDGEVIQELNMSNGLPNNNIISLFKDSRNRMWIGTYGGGAACIHGDTLQVFGLESGLMNDIIFDIEEDLQGNIYLGTFGGGINIYDDKGFTYINQKHGLKSNIIYSMDFDEFQNLWIGTEKGLSTIYGDSIYTFDKNDGLLSSTIKSILFDQNNNLWVGSEKGLDRLFINPPQLITDRSTFFSGKKKYTLQNGLIGQEINNNAMMNTLDGAIWFGSNSGAMQFRSEPEEAKVFYEPKLYLTDVQIDFVSVDTTRFKRKPYWNTPQNLALNYKENHLTFSFVGIDLNAPTQVTYQWRLKGYEEQFCPPTLNSKVTYPQLPPGDYTFEIRACSNENECTSEDYRFEFSILPPIWKRTWFVVTVFILVGGSIFLLVRRKQRLLKLENEKLENMVEERTKEVVEKNQIIETKNKEFESSVRYAKTIQQAYLPKIEQFKSHFEDAFVFFKPRDVISGDFYWFRRFDNVVVLGVADCTGHGVPGALMSMIGMTLINEVANRKDISSPCQALTYMDNGIIKALSSDKLESKDGMDIALLGIHLDKGYLQYAGANRPLYIVRDGEIIEYKPTKVALGGISDEPKQFEAHQIMFKKGDMVYLFSDGYQDQFGGPENKKYKLKYFKELLVRIAPLDGDSQHKIIQREFEEWKGDFEQTDDILVCGFRL